MKTKNIFAVLTLLIALVFAGGCGYKARVLYDPSSTQVTAGNANTVRQAIRRGMAAYGWIAESDSPGKIVARITRRQSTARVTITYSASKIDINYKDSTGLNYQVKNGVPHIHTAYNTWVMNLEKAIWQNMTF